MLSFQHVTKIKLMNEILYILPPFLGTKSKSPVEFSVCTSHVAGLY